MKCIWLGQAGFLFITHGGTTVMIDPIFPIRWKKSRARPITGQVPVQPEFLCTPDVLLITHSHADHMDFGTLDVLFEKVHRPLTVLAAEKAFWASASATEARLSSCS